MEYVRMMGRQQFSDWNSDINSFDTPARLLSIVHEGLCLSRVDVFIVPQRHPLEFILCPVPN